MKSFLPLKNYGMDFQFSGNDENIECTSDRRVTSDVLLQTKIQIISLAVWLCMGIKQKDLLEKNEPEHDKTKKATFGPSEDSD